MVDRSHAPRLALHQLLIHRRIRGSAGGTVFIVPVGIVDRDHTKDQPVPCAIDKGLNDTG